MDVLGGGVQHVFQMLGVNTTALADSGVANGTSLMSSPLDSLRALAGASDYSSLFTRVLQFGALTGMFQIFYITEWIRWFWYSLYDYTINRFIITMHFDGDEMPYMWLMLWLSKKDKWTKARDLQISSQNFGLGSTMGLLVPGEDIAGKDGQRPLSILPWNDTTHTMWFRRRLLRVTRSRRTIADGRQESALVIQMFTRSHQRMYDLLLEAKQDYEAETESRVVVYILDQFNNFYYTGSRPKRSMDSVIIPEDAKELLLEDCKDFLDSEEWYGERGIPWQRGWLLWGPPGSGKTSIIQALAGELGLHIYVVSLAKRGMDDTILSTLINSIPPRAMILMEDIDSAFTTSLNRESAPSDSTSMPGMMNQAGMLPPSSVTLSGLLNAIDGVQAQQGRLLFATTNKYDSLDPALTRPGRLDLHIEFRLATKWQAAELFKRFYPLEKSTIPNNHSSSPSGAAPERKKSVSSELTPSTTDSNPNAEKRLPMRKSTAERTEEEDATLNPRQRGRKAPKLTFQELEDLAQAFADAIPDEELSMAAIQGHLMMHKTGPHAAVRSAARFVTLERERRIKAKQLTKEQAANLEKADAQAREDKTRVTSPTTTVTNGDEDKGSEKDAESTASGTNVEVVDVNEKEKEKEKGETSSVGPGPDVSPRSATPTATPAPDTSLPLHPLQGKMTAEPNGKTHVNGKAIEPTDSIVLVDDV